MNSKLLEHINRIHSGDEEAAVMVLVVSTEAGSPQIPGARMLVTRQGRYYGTIGGGQVEKLAEEHAISMLKNNIATDSQTFDLGFSKHTPNDTRMICGGWMLLYFEHLSPPDRLIIYGYGHIGKVLAPLAVHSGLHVIAVDERYDLSELECLDDGVLKNVVLHRLQSPEHARSIIARPTDSFVIMTHEHRYDLDTLKALSIRLLPNSLPRYIGMIGSKHKNKIIIDTLKQEGVSISFLNNIRAPIGLSLGGNSPGEIAVSIMAEILAVKYGKIRDGSVESMSNK